MTTASALLEAALIDLAIAAAPFRSGRGLAAQRRALDAAINHAGRAMRACDGEGVKPDMEGLRRLAQAADAEARDQPGYRADLEG